MNLYTYLQLKGDILITTLEKILDIIPFFLSEKLTPDVLVSVYLCFAYTLPLFAFAFIAFAFSISFTLMVFVFVPFPYSF